MTRCAPPLMLAAALTVSAAVPIASSVTGQQQPAFRATTEVVLVDALVTRNGRPAEGLTANDFEVHDSGVRQAVALVGMQTVPVDLRLLLDVSGSLEGQQLAALKAAARAAIASFRALGGGWDAQHASSNGLSTTNLASNDLSTSDRR